ncbi:MoaF protein precursor [Lachnospiraceae bacterium KM106-2]|nr:MoaF protein precursor [Lachnospiraceae bacterium KM106-2]
MSNKNDFPTVEELSNGFSEFKKESTKDLLGTSVTLNYENGSNVIYTFLDEECMKASYSKDGQEEAYACIYTAVSPREGIYLVDFIEDHGLSQSITTVIDKNLGIATTMRAQLPTREEADVSQLVRAMNNMPMTSVKAEYLHAAVDAPFTDTTKKHEFTKELIGKHVRFRYSSNDTYEHIYLNDKYYTWHCVSGIENGLCDTDRCYYIKLAENLYWFTWLEKVVPTIGTVIEDLSPEVMRSYGKLAGYDSYDHGKITNFQVGSYATEL